MDFNNNFQELNFSNLNLDELLEKKFTSIYRPGYINYKGYTLPKAYEKLKDDIDNFEVYDDDVWICSFPKTGTTWTQEMIWLIANDLNFVAAEETLGARFPFLEVSMMYDWKRFKAEIGNYNQHSIFLDDSLKFVREMKRPRFIKTHLPWKLLPEQIQNGEKSPKIIYVTRDPRAVCVSYFHHVCLFEGFIGSFKEFFELFLQGKVIFGPFWDNVLPFWNKKHKTNFLFIKYEEMKTNLSEVIDKITKFLGKSMKTEEEKQKLLRHLSFGAMKSNMAVNGQKFMNFYRKCNFLPATGAFIRSGTNEWENILKPEMERRIDVWINKNDPNNELGYNKI